MTQMQFVCVALLPIAPFVVSAILAAQRSDLDTVSQAATEPIVTGDVGGASSCQRTTTEVDPALSGGDRMPRVSSGSTPTPALGCPESFPYDGVYIWRDPDGLWTILWRGEYECGVQIQITDVGVAPELSVGEQTHLSFLDDRWLIEGNALPTGGLAQFWSDGESITLDVRLGGQPAPDHVFIGQYLHCPDQGKFRVDDGATSDRMNERSRGGGAGGGVGGVGIPDK